MVHVSDAKAETIRKVVETHVHDDVEVILTDDFRAYPIALICGSDGGGISGVFGPFIPTVFIAFFGSGGACIIL